MQYSCQYAILCATIAFVGCFSHSTGLWDWRVRNYELRRRLSRLAAILRRRSAVVVPMMVFRPGWKRAPSSTQFTKWWPQGDLNPRFFLERAAI